MGAARVIGFWETFDVSQNRRPVNYYRLCFGALLPVVGGSLFPPCLLGVLPCPPINHPPASTTPARVGRTNALTLNPTPCAGETALSYSGRALPAQATHAFSTRLVPSAPCALRPPCGHASAQATHKPSGGITFDFEQVPQKKRTRGCSPFFEKTGGEKTFNSLRRERQSIKHRKRLGLYMRGFRVPRAPATARRGGYCPASCEECPRCPATYCV